MAVAAMTIAWGCATCVERNLHWYSTRVDGGMCSCGAPQSGSDITGLVSPGLCGAGCAVQGGEEAGCEEGALGWSVRRQRRSAPCAWRAAVVLPRIRAEMMGENYWVPPHSPAQAASCSARGAQRREPDAMEERALRLWAAHPREAMEERVPRQLGNCLRLLFRGRVRRRATAKRP